MPRIERPARFGVRDDGVPLSRTALLANVALTQGLFGAVLAAGVLFFGVPFESLGISGEPLAAGPAGVAAGAGFGLVLWLGNEVAGAASEADETLRGLLAPRSVRGWVLVLGVVLPTVAVVEEFVFRAALVGAVAVGTGASPWALAVVSSVAFGLAHGAQGRAGIVIATGLGFALAAGFILTGSLLVVVIAHYVVNAAELLVHEGLGVGRLPEHV